jgi:hypothetical protein
MLLTKETYVVLLNNDWISIDELYTKADAQPILRGVTLTVDRDRPVTWEQSLVTINKVIKKTAVYKYTFNDLSFEVADCELLSKDREKYITTPCGKNVPLVVFALKTMLTIEQPHDISVTYVEQEFYEVLLKDPVYIFVGIHRPLFRNYSIAVCAR